jgi:hypothetical protein
MGALGRGNGLSRGEVMQMPKLAEIITPSELVLESIRKIARETSFHAIYMFLMPDPVNGG